MVTFPLTLGPVDVTPKEYRRLCFYQLFRRQLLRLIVRIVPIYLLFFIGPDLVRGKFHWLPTLIALVLWVVFLVLFMMGAQAWQVRKVRRQMADYLTELRWVLSDEGFEFHNRRVTLKYKWDELRDPLFSASTAYIHLRNRPSVALYMPLRGLPAGVTPAALAEKLAELT